MAALVTPSLRSGLLPGRPVSPVSSGANFGGPHPGEALSLRPRLPGGYPPPTPLRHSLWSNACIEHYPPELGCCQVLVSGDHSPIAAVTWRPGRESRCNPGYARAARLSRGTQGWGTATTAARSQQVPASRWRRTSNRITAVAIAVFRDSTSEAVGMETGPWASSRA